jgi:hypothetical protein
MEKRMSSFVERMISAAKLKADIYEEVEADKGAIGQAVAVVLLSSAAAGIGAYGTGGGPGIVAGLLAALLGWLLWAFLIYIIGSKFFPEAQTKTDMGELLRTIGFASSPGIIRIFGVVPGLTGIFFLVGSLWMFAAMVVGVRQALDYKSTARAFGVCIAGWLVQVLMIVFLLYFAGVQPR